jgi:flagellar hook-length control protein FliK
MALAAVAPPADGPPQSQSRAAQRGEEPFERAMARAREAEERGDRPLAAVAEAAPEATDEEPQTEKTEAREANANAPVAPAVTAVIEALIAPQQTQPDRTAEVGPQQQPSLTATASGVIASFETPVPALAKARVSVDAPEVAPVTVEAVLAPALEADAVVIDGLQAVQPEVARPPTEAPVSDPPTAGEVAMAAEDDTEPAAPRGAADAAVESLEVDAAGAADATTRSTPAADLGSEGGEPSEGESSSAPVPDAGNELAAPRGVDAPAMNVAQPIEATASSSVGNAADVMGTQPVIEVDAVARTVDTSNAPQLASRLADTVQAAVRTGEHSMRLVLNPPDLGQLDVRVVERPDGISVSLAAESSDARDLLQQHLPARREPSTPGRAAMGTAGSSR